MSNEDYVSIEVAKKLQEKGYKEPCYATYFMEFKDEFTLSIGTYKKTEYEELLHIPSKNMQLQYLAPTLYEAQKWLRETHNIDVLPIIREESLPKKDYCCYIYKDAKVVSCKVAYGEDFYECMNDSLLEVLKNIL